MKKSLSLGAMAFAAVFFSASLALAAPISAEQAQKAMSKWIRSRPAAHMDAHLGSVKSARTATNTSGEPIFHVINLETGGFIVTPTDDQIRPVVAFSDNGTLDEDERNPLWTMLNLDLPRRKAMVRSLTATVNSSMSAASGLAGSPRQIVADAASEWADLLSDDDESGDPPLEKGLSYGQSSISDVRVPALLTTRWDQETDGAGYKCYNYYTPNNYYCGCVATATAQLMRKHCFPTKSIAAKTFSCWVGTTATDKTMMGGTYDWNNMPNEPGSGTTDKQRQAIGKLCYDVGVASRMQWQSGGSGACLLMTAISLIDVFGYSSACSLQSSSSISESEMQKTIFANLDGGCPVLLGIRDSAGQHGHAIVADGYGYYNSTVYTHLNFGWGGGSDAWYDLPSIGTKNNYSIVDTVVYNVFPSQSGELLTGRVTDSSGSAIEGATVTVSYSGGSTYKQVATNAKGIYAVCVPAGTWQVSVAKSGYVASLASAVKVVKSVSDKLTSVSAGRYSYSKTGTVGNSWGNNFALSAATTYSVVYNKGTYGTGSQQTATKTQGVALTLKGAIFTRTGYTQTGWSKNTGGSTKDYSLGASYTTDASVTLYPYWTKNTYSITYALNSGTQGSTYPASATYDTAFSVSAPTRTGYTFAGWTVTSGLNTSTAKWGTGSSPSTAIGGASTKCMNGATGSVYFKNLTPTSGVKVTLMANWTLVPTVLVDEVRKLDYIGMMGGTTYVMWLENSTKGFLVDDVWLEEAGIDISGGVTPAVMNAIGRNGIPRYESLLLGLDPESSVPAEEQLHPTITFDAAGKPVISCFPRKESELVTYTELGKRSIGDAEWEKVTDINRSSMKFFKVKVELAK